jgi:hypothetical protein
MLEYAWERVGFAYAATRTALRDGHWADRIGIDDARTDGVREDPGECRPDVGVGAVSERVSVLLVQVSHNSFGAGGTKRAQ